MLRRVVSIIGELLKSLADEYIMKGYANQDAIKEAYSIISKNFTEMEIKSELGDTPLALGGVNI